MTTPTELRPSTPVRLAAGLATFFFVVAVVGAVFLVVTDVVGAVRGGQEVSFRGSVSVTADDTRLPSFVDQPGVADVQVHIPDASTKQELLALARDAGPIVLILVGLWLVRAVLMSVRRGDPFTPTNVRRLRLVAVLLIAVTAVEIFRHYCDNALASTVPHLREWPNGGDVSLNGPAAGIVVLVLAEVFAYGVRLREDVEGTV